MRRDGVLPTSALPGHVANLDVGICCGVNVCSQNSFVILSETVPGSKQEKHGGGGGSAITGWVSCSLACLRPPRNEAQKILIKHKCFNFGLPRLKPGMGLEKWLST